MFKRRKRNERQWAAIRAQMRNGEEWQPVTLANVSEHGALVKVDGPPPVGSRVEIRHRSVGISGEVVWATKTRFGMKSDEPIDLEALLAQSEVKVRHARIDAPIRDQRWWHWRKDG